MSLRSIFAPADMFMPPLPPGMLMAGLGLRSSSSSIEGLLQEKSSSRMTASWMPLLIALASRTISGAASRLCSCNPKCECIQRVPAGWGTKL